jgi:hypothetical protein
MTPPHLAQDVIDAILEHLHDHVSALRRCSTVARSWTFSSQSHLFSSITLKSRKNAEKLGRAFHGSPWLADHVRNLRLDLILSGDNPISVHDAIGTTLTKLQTLWVDFGDLFRRTSDELSLPYFTSAHSVGFSFMILKCNTCWSNSALCPRCNLAVICLYLTP